MSRIRMRHDYKSDEGYSFYEGESLDVVNLDRTGAEVKVAGEYVWIPRTHFGVYPTR